MSTIYRAILVACALLMTTEMSFAKGKKKSDGNAENGTVASEAGPGPKSSRERNIIREGRQKKGDRSKIDFDSTDISGQRKMPLGSLVSQNKPDKDYDFVKLRWQWHPEMVQSASSIEGGRTR